MAETNGTVRDAAARDASIVKLPRMAVRGLAANCFETKEGTPMLHLVYFGGAKYLPLEGEHRRLNIGAGELVDAEFELAPGRDDTWKVSRLLSIKPIR